MTRVSTALRYIARIWVPTMKALETQVGQLATVIKGQSSRSFPSDTETNPNECKAIKLRSDKELEELQARNEKTKKDVIKGEDYGK